MVLIAVLLVIYIANVHSVEKNLREAQLLKKEIKELRWEYMSYKNEIMYQGTASQIAERVKIMELKEAGDKVKKIKSK